MEAQALTTSVKTVSSHTPKAICYRRILEAQELSDRPQPVRYHADGNALALVSLIAQRGLLGPAENVDVLQLWFDRDAQLELSLMNIKGCQRLRGVVELIGKESAVPEKNTQEKDMRA